MDKTTIESVAQRVAMIVITSNGQASVDPHAPAPASPPNLIQIIIQIITTLLAGGKLCGLAPAAAHRRMVRQGPLERRSIKHSVRQHETNPAMWAAEQDGISQVGRQLTIQEYTDIMAE